MTTAITEHQSTDVGQGTIEPFAAPRVFEGVDFSDGRVNTDDETILEHVRRAIRRQHMQVWPMQAHYEQAVIVGGGPSLEDSFDELRDLIFDKAHVVTLNGSYQWCLDRNIRPAAQLVMDARAFNARFVSPMVPRCSYYLASQCHPDLWDAVAAYDRVAIFHDVASPAIEAELNRYYEGSWSQFPGGTTVGTRAIGLLMALGFRRIHLFGFDSCWMDGKHHAYAQPENDRDRRLKFTIADKDDPSTSRTFECAPWHVKQAEDFITLIRLYGKTLNLSVHGDGLLAFLLRTAANVTVQQV